MSTRRLVSMLGSRISLRAWILVVLDYLREASCEDDIKCR
jgi:hypothetical protein